MYVKEIRGPLVIVEGFEKPLSYGELVYIESEYGKKKGIVVDSYLDKAVVLLLESTSGLKVNSSAKRTLETVKFGVSPDYVGGFFNGFGEPIKGLKPIPEEYLDIHGSAINPTKRAVPNEPIITQISTIDCLFTIVRGQKIAIFSSPGVPHYKLATQIVRQAKLPDNEDFIIILSVIGLQKEVVEFIIRELERSGAIHRTAVFISESNAPATEKITNPRIALTLAEYLAFTYDYHVLVLLIDMTNYCEALKEISSLKGEIPGRRGYPGYMYTDLATIYERTGRIKGKKGSITQIPILTMPNNDITHPVPDLTGYITEGQIVLDISLFQRGIYPPVEILRSLSRLMKFGIGKGKTREDHKEVAMQLQASYAESLFIREISTIVGEESLSEKEKKYLEFLKEFENKFMKQGYYEARDIYETLDLAWNLLSILPEEELTNISEETLRKYHPKYKK